MHWAVGIAVSIGAALLTAAPVHAERLVFANGRTVVVRDVTISGDSITVTLVKGGRATFARALVADILPDEVPLPPLVSPTGSGVAGDGDAALSSTASGDPVPGADGVAAVAAEAVATITSAAAPRAAVAPEVLARRPFATLITETANRHGVDPVLVHAVIQAESNYQPRARSKAGARGLMQVMPATGRSYGVRNLYDPKTNLDVGVRYLKSLLQRFDLTHAIAAYNAGPGAVERYQGVPPFAETELYVRKVLAGVAR